MRFIILFVIIMFSAVSVSSQVVIGADEAPEDGALLQLKDIVSAGAGAVNAEKGGLLLPRVQLEAIDLLKPFIASPTDDQKLNHRGLLVYNMTVLEDGTLSRGIYQWDGAKWQRLDEARPLAKISAIDCNRLRIAGEYFKNAALNSFHYIELPVTFSHPGAYTVTIRTGNGYYFQKTGIIETTGKYMMTLEGIGMPSEIQTDNLTVYLNDEVITPDCTMPDIVVKSPSLSYYVNCNDISVNGEYLIGQSMDPADNYVEIPIEIDNYVADSLEIKSSVLNGVYFVFKEVVAEGTNTIFLGARGTPQQAGIFTYEFTTNGSNKTTCRFEVKVSSNLGSVNNPAKSCAAILQADPTKPDGEYFIATSDVDNTAIRTYCDMTHGGYTLVWSYSEKTSYTNSATSIYSPNNTIEMYNGNQRFSQNQPRNLLFDGNGAINYADFRLPLSSMKNIKSDPVLGAYRVRICYVPTNMSDAWGDMMYLNIKPSAKEYDIIESTSSYKTTREIKIQGMLFGKPFVSDGLGNTSSVTYAGQTVSNNITLYIDASYGVHFNADYLTLSGTLLTTYLPKHPDDGGELYEYQFYPQGLNNIFGYHAEYMLDHSFGKCRSTTSDSSAEGDDYANNRSTTSANNGCTSGNRTPHSFNNGEGRYLQWFIK